MTLTRTKTELRGKLSDVLEAVSESYPDVANMTRDVAAVMMASGCTKLEVDSDVYTKLVDVDVILSVNDDKVYLEIL